VPSFIAYIDGKEFFSSDQSWLYPLLELETELSRNRPPGVLSTYDRVVGRASALLSARLGVSAIRTDTLSARAVDVLEQNRIRVTTRTKVDRIPCVTEDLLADVADPDEARELIRKRQATP
jgi:hypothetical protein